jgi:hypothetical protein
MASAAVTTNVHQALNVLSYDTAQITFDDELTLNHLAKAIHLFLGQRTHLSPRIDPARLQRLTRKRPPNTVYVCQRYLHVLLAWDIDPGYSRHRPHYLSGNSPTFNQHRRGELALLLLVLRVSANNHDRAVALNHTTLVAPNLDRRGDLHELPLTA